jgi:hypothetical protein
MPHGGVQTEVSHHAQHGGLSNSGDFDPEQAAMLQDLARNGAPEESQVYGYPEAGLNGVQLNGYGDGSLNGMQANGIIQDLDFVCTVNVAHPEAGLLQGQPDIDLDDPAALLESLANFEHPPPTSNAPISNNHFASLLQAAATAGGQEAGRNDVGQTRRSARQLSAAKHPRISQSSPTRQRDQNNQLNIEEPHAFVTRGSKRKQIPEDIDEAEQLAREHEIWGPAEPEEEYASTFSIQYDNPPIGASDARAAGVHSATALFRRPSVASRKYTSTFPVLYLILY